MMKIGELKMVGVAFTSDGDLLPLVVYKNAEGVFTMYRNNDIFGMQMLLGFSEVEFEPMAGSTANDYRDILTDPDFAGYQGIAKIEDGLLLIKDFDCAQCSIIRGAVTPENCVPLNEYLDSGEFEDFDDCPYYESLMEFFE